jgi:hypothetical protein
MREMHVVPGSVIAPYARQGLRAREPARWEKALRQIGGLAAPARTE